MGIEIRMYVYVCMQDKGNKKNNNGGAATATVTDCWQQKSVRAVVVRPSIRPFVRSAKQTNETITAKQRNWRKLLRYSRWMLLVKMEEISSTKIKAHHKRRRSSGELSRTK